MPPQPSPARQRTGPRPPASSPAPSASAGRPAGSTARPHASGPSPAAGPEGREPGGAVLRGGGAGPGSAPTRVGGGSGGEDPPGKARGRDPLPSLRVSPPQATASPAAGHTLSPHLFPLPPFATLPYAALHTPHRFCMLPPAPALDPPCPTRKRQGASRGDTSLHPNV